MTDTANIAAENKIDTTPQRVTPFLWFSDRAEEAVNFYLSVFNDSELMDMHRLPAEAPGKSGRMLTATLRIMGTKFMILEGGPMFEFSPAVSFFIHCKTQEEVDDLWDKLTAGGVPNRCGWLTDKFGITWQVIPDALGRLMGDPNPLKAKAVQEMMMQMVKIDISQLQEAYDKAG